MPAAAKTKSDPAGKLKLVMELVAIDSIQPMRGNAKIGDVSAIRESLRVNGQFRPIVVRRETLEILAGNHTWKAARQENWTHIYVGWISCTDEEARRINLADNRTSELGGYDEQALVNLLGELPSLEGTGWQQSDLDEMVAKLGGLGSPDLPGADDIPPDHYEAQFGVIVLCSDQEQQEKVFGALREQIHEDEIYQGVKLKIVAV